jgi:nucleoid DNA-binding protein
VAGIKDVAARAGLDHELAGRVFSAVLDLVASGEDVRILHFGTFYRHRRNARRFVMPFGSGADRSAEGVVPAQSVIKLRPASSALAFLNKVEPMPEVGHRPAERPRQRTRGGKGFV